MWKPCNADCISFYLYITLLAGCLDLVDRRSGGYGVNPPLFGKATIGNMGVA